MRLSDAPPFIGKSVLLLVIHVVILSKFLRSYRFISIHLLARRQPDPTFCHVVTFLYYVRGFNASTWTQFSRSSTKITEKYNIYYITHLRSNGRAPGDLPATLSLSTFQNIQPVDEKERLSIIMISRL